jgi:DNA-binding response OmpR family regulator
MQGRRTLETMANAVELRTLLVTLDSVLADTITNISRELSIDVQTSTSVGEIPEELAGTKYEALFLDFDTVTETAPILDIVRGSPSNKNALIFAVATGAVQKREALQQGANFVLERPIAATEVRRSLYAAYDLMARERRRYFRYTAELPVLLQESTSGMDLSCTTINISSSGVAVSAPAPLSPGAKVNLVLLLKDPELAVRGSGCVVWDDKHGKAGINFQCASPAMQQKFEGWLDLRFSTLLRSPLPH